MKKIFAMLLALVMVLSLAACASTQPAAEPAASSDAPAESGKTYTVGVCQLVQHEALDAATQGFVDALKEALGDAVTIDYLGTRLAATVGTEPLVDPGMLRIRR